MRNKLEDYYLNKKRIPVLSEQIEDAKNDREVMGAYQTCNNESFHLQEKVMVEPVADYDKIAQLQKTQQDIIQECAEVDRYLLGITDPAMNLILTIGYTKTYQDWEAVADYFGMEKSGEAYKKKAHRYLKKF